MNMDGRAAWKNFQFRYRVALRRSGFSFSTTMERIRVAYRVGINGMSDFQADRSKLGGSFEIDLPVGC